MKVIAMLVAGCLCLGGCASNPPVEETRLVARSFDSLNAASQPLLDELAVAERNQGKAAALARAEMRTSGDPIAPVAETGNCTTILVIGGETENMPKVQNGFCVEDSYYYSDLSDPPATRAFRQALAAVGDYTQLLLILAEGRNVAEAKEQLTTLSSNLGMALGAAGASGLGPALQGLVRAFDPLLDLAANRSNAQELRRLVVQESPGVLNLVAAMRTAAGEFFTTLTEAPLARFSLAIDKPGEARVDADRIEVYRVAVSNYVVLLDQYEALLRDLVKGYSQPRGAITLASLAERSAQLSAQSDAWRRSLASLRAGLR